MGQGTPTWSDIVRDEINRRAADHGRGYVNGLARELGIAQSRLWEFARGRTLSADNLQTVAKSFGYILYGPIVRPSATIERMTKPEARSPSGKHDQADNSPAK